MKIFKLLLLTKIYFALVVISLFCFSIGLILVITQAIR